MYTLFVLESAYLGVWPVCVCWKIILFYVQCFMSPDLKCSTRLKIIIIFDARNPTKNNYILFSSLTIIIFDATRLKIIIYFPYFLPLFSTPTWQKIDCAWKCHSLSGGRGLSWRAFHRVEIIIFFRLGGFRKKYVLPRNFFIQSLFSTQPD